MKKTTTLLMILGLMASSAALAQDYVIDKKGMHASIQFKISHLGYSWLWGRFNDFDGTLSYDKNKPEASKVVVNIKTSSVDSNHELRDKHIRGEGLLETDKFPTAKFVSTGYTPTNESSGSLKGKLTLHGVTRLITIDVKKIGEGKDPWGGYRVGFEGSTHISLADFNITKNLGPASKELELILAIEAIKNKE